MKKFQILIESTETRGDINFKLSKEKESKLEQRVKEQTQIEKPWRGVRDSLLKEGGGGERKNITSLEGPQASPARPSDKILQK